MEADVVDGARFLVVPMAILGGIVGSFLNVVIFRLPRDLSVMRPRWSFCPHCKHRIRPYDNVPIFGWLWLRGRCRDCGTAISSLYPLIECLTSLLFVMTWDALFVGGTPPPVAGAAPSLAIGWPIAVAYGVLFSGLLANAAMDIESYTIDIRVTFFTMAMGVACHTVAWWGTGEASAADAEAFGVAVPPALCLVGVAMGIAWGLTALIASRVRSHARQSGEIVPVAADVSGIQTYDDTVTPLRTDDESRFRPLPVLAMLGVLGALAAWQVLAPNRGAAMPLSPVGQRGFVAGLLFFFALILASMVHREADEQIVEDIESERHGARATAWRELAGVLPALLVGIAALTYLRHGGSAAQTWNAWLGSATPYMVGPIVSISGLVFAAGLGWAVRILGTLSFGKEAFGSGDIYILAAIGAVGGFWLVVFGFFLAALLALVGVLATIFHKANRAIPFGPWLALGAFVAMYLYGPLVTTFAPLGRLLLWVLTGEPAI
ncbi:MAG: prepilin peptidase [Phycisphaerae bacterium]